MAFYGDSGYGTSFRLPPHTLRNSMSTAIVRTYTREGFLIAADGRSINTEDQSIISDDTQKIFHVKGQGGLLAYSLTGTSHITPTDSDQIIFDMRAEINREVNHLVGRKSRNLTGYAIRVCRAVSNRLASVADTYGTKFYYPEDAAVFPGEMGRTIVRIFFEGYHEGLPSRVEIRLFHENQRLRLPEVVSTQLSSGFHAFGSRAVWDAFLDSADTRFDSYKVPVTKYEDPSLAEAVRFARGYIAACSDPEALKIDPGACCGIGGRIHMATITKSKGFQWVSGFEPINGLTG